MSEIYDQDQIRDTLRSNAASYWLMSRIFLFGAALTTAMEGLNAPLRPSDVVTPLALGLVALHYSNKSNTFERLAETGRQTPVELDGLQARRV